MIEKPTSKSRNPTYPSKLGPSHRVNAKPPSSSLLLLRSFCWLQLNRSVPIANATREIMIVVTELPHFVHRGTIVNLACRSPREFLGPRGLRFLSSKPLALGFRWLERLVHTS